MPHEIICPTDIRNNTEGRILSMLICGNLVKILQGLSYIYKYNHLKFLDDTYELDDLIT